MTDRCKNETPRHGKDSYCEELQREVGRESCGMAKCNYYQKVGTCYNCGGPLGENPVNIRVRSADRTGHDYCQMCKPTSGAPGKQKENPTTKECEFCGGPLGDDPLTIPTLISDSKKERVYCSLDCVSAHAKLRYDSPFKVTQEETLPAFTLRRMAENKAEDHGVGSQSIKEAVKEALDEMGVIGSPETLQVKCQRSECLHNHCFWCQKSDGKIGMDEEGVCRSFEKF